MEKSYHERTKMKMNPSRLYDNLLKEFGNLNWWPVDKDYHKRNHSDPRYEIIVGAILTQNTAWSNVERALNNLKSCNTLDINNISTLKLNEIQELVRPSGFFNQKGKRLKDLTAYIVKNYDGNLDRFFNRSIAEIREELLSLNGIGPETADSIILYAGNLPIFVVDAYTKRVCERLCLDTSINYDDIQDYFEKELSNSYPKNELVQIYNELHALIVIFAKNYCKKKPNCKSCPLEKQCNFENKLFQ